MSHFAQLDANGSVIAVIVAEQDFINTLPDAERWVRTSYNATIRKNFAGIGYTYDSARDAFIPPCPGPDAVLDEQTCTWVLP